MGPVNTLRGRRVRAVAALLFALAATASCMAQPPPIGQVLGPVLDKLPPAAVPPTENETGQDVHSEDIRIHIGLDVRNVDYEVVGIVFGGGKVAADVEARLRLEFRAVSLARLDEALRAASGEYNVSVARTFGFPADRFAITAEEVRAAGAGQLLAAFQSFEAVQARRYLEASLPGLAVLDIDVAWSNTVPAQAIRDIPLGNGTPFPADLVSRLDPVSALQLREPPIVLEARADLHYLQRTDLLEILRGATRARSPEESRVEALKQSLREKETGRASDRTAFQLLGFGQVFNLTVPPGWLVDVDVRVPQGFTVEGATSELSVDPDHLGLSARVDGDGRLRTASQASLVVLSSRYLVTVAALVAVVLAGFVVRLPLEAAWLWSVYHLHRRRGKDVPKPAFVHWPGRRWGR